MPTPLTTQFPAPSGVLASFFGSNAGGATNRYYWVQAIYPGGKSTLTRSNLLSSMPSALNNQNQVLVSWTPMAGAIGYNVYYTTSSTAPTNGSILVGTVTGASFTDQGLSNSGNLQTGYVVPDGFRVAHARYDFAIDGGAQATIVLSLSDTIPAGAILLGGVLNPTTAFVGATAIIGVGVSAGGSTATIKALATTVATYTVDAVLAVIPTMAAPVKMTADGTVTITIGTANLTAGVMDIFVFYVLPVNL